MSVVDFWNTIHESGQVLVDPPVAPAAANEDAALRAAIERVEADWRGEIAFDAPALVTPVAVWAAEVLYHACQFLVYREVDPQTVSDALAIPSPLPPSPEVRYSADLALRVLPDVLTLARAASPDDPLVKALAEIARRWPLSSVGEPLTGADVSPFIDHRGLRGLYADRILMRGDTSRLDDPRVREAVRVAVGAHGAALAPNAVLAALGADREQ